MFGSVTRFSKTGLVLLQDLVKQVWFYYKKHQK